MTTRTDAAVALAEAVHAHALADAALVEDSHHEHEGSYDERVATQRAAWRDMLTVLVEYRRARSEPDAPSELEMLRERVVQTALRYALEDAPASAQDDFYAACDALAAHLASRGAR
jgi:hypothetical protein